MECIKCKIEGKVQGVGFRWSTKRKADSLGIKGYAANLPDGSVEILACGDPKNLDTFKKWLETEGPAFSNIQNITYSQPDITETPASFETY